MFGSIRNALFWRVQKPATDAALKFAMNAAKVLGLGAVGATVGATKGLASTLFGSWNVVKNGQVVARGRQGLLHTLYDKAASNVKRDWPWWRSFVSDFLLGGEPLFEEVENPYYKSYVDTGLKGRLGKYQNDFNTWRSRWGVDASGTPYATPPEAIAGRNPVHAPPTIVTFTRSFRNKIFVGAGLFAGIDTLRQLQYHENPNVEVIDETPQNGVGDALGYGTTGSFGLAAYYANR